MKGLVALVPAVALIASCADQPLEPADFAPAFAATTSTTNIVVPYDVTAFNPCALGGAGEDVALSGELRILTHITVDGRGGIHLRAHFQPVGVTGMGATTGATYNAVGVTQDGQKFGRLPAVFTSTNNYRLIGKGRASNFHVHENVHVTIGVDGSVKADVDHASTTCR
jgi:hypothetical protein